MSKGKVTRLHGDEVGDALDSMLELYEQGNMNHLLIIAVMADGTTVTNESWRNDGSRPFHLVGAMESAKQRILEKTQD